MGTEAVTGTAGGPLWRFCTYPAPGHGVSSRGTPFYLRTRHCLTLCTTGLPGSSVLYLPLPRTGRVAAGTARLRFLVMVDMGTVTLAGTTHEVPLPTALHSRGSLALPVALKAFLWQCRQRCLALAAAGVLVRAGRGAVGQTHECSKSTPSHDHSWFRLSVDALKSKRNARSRIWKAAHTSGTLPSKAAPGSVCA